MEHFSSTKNNNESLSNVASRAGSYMFNIYHTFFRFFRTFKFRISFVLNHWILCVPPRFVMSDASRGHIVAVVVVVVVDGAWCWVLDGGGGGRFYWDDEHW